jgi:class 3 adenylate cyclase/tetratricopeptide (TPR) repeat protein
MHQPGAFCQQDRKPVLFDREHLLGGTLFSMIVVLAWNMKCVRCQRDCPASAKFCQECGAPLAAGGAVSGTFAAATAYDDGHGTPASTHSHAIEDRRQAVVLFADISGYTAQCARSDPEQVREMLVRFYAAMEEVVARYGGQILDRIGDAVMAAFGAPVAHGNDPERALRAALDMHAAAADLVDCDGLPMVLHIGAARGEVVTAVNRSGSAATYSITGATVNLAARLVALAAPGDTLISEAVYRAVPTLIAAESLGAHTLKGFALPVTVWRMQRLCAASTPLSPFVGRESEMMQLAAALDGACVTGKGMTIFIRGNAGIGKSRLVNEVRARASLQGFDVPLEQVLDFGVAKGKAAVPALLKAILAAAAPGSGPDLRAVLQQAIDTGLVLEDEALLIAALLELELSAAEEAAWHAVDNDTRARRTEEDLTMILQRVARNRPLLVTVEDIHWASGETLRHLLSIAQAAVQAPLILVMTSRIEGDPLDQTWRATLHGSPLLTLDLAPMLPHEASRLASEWVDVSSDFAQRCIDRAEGNPLFLEQLLRAPHESGPAGVPPTIQSLVLERVDRLSPAVRIALQAASVIGKRFSAHGLRTLSGDAIDHCEALVAADMIRCDGEDYQFTHALIQEAVYVSILQSRKRLLHRQLAHLAGEREPVLRAQHLDRADDPEAAHAYFLAARDETKRFRYDSALSLARRGIALAGEPALKCELSLLSGELLRELGSSADSLDAYRAALDLAADDVRRCKAWMGVAAGCRVTGDFAQAIDALSHAQDLANRLQLDGERSQIHNMRGNLYYARGDAVACEAEHVQALRHAQRSMNSEYEVRALSGLGDAQLDQGRMQQALRSFRQCVALCARHGWIAIEIPNRCMLGHCLRYAALLDEAIAEVERATADAQRLGLVPAQVFALMTLATVLVDAGRVAETEAVCLKGIPLARLAGARRFESSLLLSLADIRLRQGRRDEAMQEIETALALAYDTGLGFAGAATFGMIARAASSSEKRAQALREGEALLAQPCLAHSVLRFHVNAIEACIEAAEWDDTLRYARSLETFMRAEPLPWATLVIERARALSQLATGADKSAARHQLECVRKDLLKAGLGSALTAIDAALAASGYPDARPGPTPWCTSCN